MSAPRLENYNKRNRDNSDDRDRDRDIGRDEHRERVDSSKYPRTDRNDDIADQRNANYLDIEYDSYVSELEEESEEGGTEYVNFKTLLATFRDFMGEDLPPVEPKPRPTRVILAFRLEPEKERVADYIPVGHMIKSSVILAQENFFGSTAKELSELSTLPVTVPDKKTVGRLTVFKARFHRTEDYLQPRPKQVEANSLWPDKRIDKSKTVSMAPKVLANIGAAAERWRSLMAINYFALVQKKAISVIANKKSTKEQVAAALDISSQITASMGRCLEDVTRQQKYILTSATEARREAVFRQHKMPTEASDWLRAQPILTGTALFGPVAGKEKPLLLEHLVRKTQEKFISNSKSHRESGTSSYNQQQRPSSKQSSTKGRPASNSS
jgi:hypothetical protein